VNQPPVNPNEDIAIFADHCVVMRSIYLHGKILFEASTDEDKARKSRAAPTLFGDINRVFVEYIILQVCKITDPAQDFRKNDNHTIAFLLQHYDFSADPATMQRLAQLAARLQDFRQKLLPARNKRISHSDRDAIMAREALGGAPPSEWDEFWLNLQEVVCIIYEKVLGTPFYINGVAMLSDAHGLLKALKHGACFDELLNSGDPELTRRCADLAATARAISRPLA
jgi:AbiU2